MWCLCSWGCWAELRVFSNLDSFSQTSFKYRLILPPCLSGCVSVMVAMCCSSQHTGMLNWGQDSPPLPPLIVTHYMLLISEPCFTLTSCYSWRYPTWLWGHRLDCTCAAFMWKLWYGVYVWQQFRGQRSGWNRRQKEVQCGDSHLWERKCECGIASLFKYWELHFVTLSASLGPK